MDSEAPLGKTSPTTDSASAEPYAKAPQVSPRIQRATVWPALRRGWARRCPRCGGDRLFARFFTLRQGCNRCKLSFEVNPGDTWALWLIGDRVFIGLLIIAVFLVFRSDSWTFGVFLVVVTVVPLFWTMPHRMGVCIAVDYLVRSRWGDLAGESTESAADLDDSAAAR